MNINLLRINNRRFSIKLCTVAKCYNFKTIGKFYSFLIEHSPKGTLYFRGSSVSVKSLIKELDTFKNSL